MNILLFDKTIHEWIKLDKETELPLTGETWGNSIYILIIKSMFKVDSLDEIVQRENDVINYVKNIGNDDSYVNITEDIKKQYDVETLTLEIANDVEKQLRNGNDLEECI